MKTLKEDNINVQEVLNVQDPQYSIVHLASWGIDKLQMLSKDVFLELNNNSWDAVVNIHSIKKGLLTKLRISQKNIKVITLEDQVGIFTKNMTLLAYFNYIHGINFWA